MKNKVWSILLSLVIAFAMWTYVVTTVSPGSDSWYYRVPINLRGDKVLQDRGLMVVSTSVATANLHLEGNRSDLSKVDSSNITLEADLSDIAEPGKHSLRYTISYPVGVSGLKVLSSSTDTVEVVVARRISKNIQVDVVIENDVGQDYYADKENITFIDEDLDLVPEDSFHIRITGPEEVVEQVHHAQVVLDLKDRTTTVDEVLRYTLLDKLGNPVDAGMISVDVEEVRVQIKILKRMDLPLVLEVIDGAGATAETSQIVIDPPTLSVAGREEELQKLKQLVLGTVNLKDITGESWTQTYTITLPEGVQDITGATEATVTITFPRLATKELVITQFVPLNMPEGLELSVQTHQMVITLRGLKEEINKITATDLEVAFDMRGAKEGEGLYAARITISSKYPSVGVLSSGQIAATLTKPATTAEASDPTDPSGNR